MINLDEMRQQLDLLKDEELISILREHDVEQWRPEVFDIVSAILRERGVSPGKEDAVDETPGEDMADEIAGLDLVTVASYLDYDDAETDRLALASKGLKTWIFNKHADSVAGFVPGVELQVRTGDLTAAMAILESQSAPSTDLPPEIAEPPCPKCGSRQVTEEAGIAESPAASNSASPRQIWLYRCASCGYKWSES